MKRTKIIIILVILIIVGIFLLVPKSKNNVLTCTKNNSYVDGITNSENLSIKIIKNSITEIKLQKNINFDTYYTADSSSYVDAIFKGISDSYSFLDNNDYSIEKTTNDIKINVNIKDKGIILNNIDIKLSGESKDDIKITPYFDLDNDTTSIKINENIKIKEAKEKLENFGYSCNLK